MWEGEGAVTDEGDGCGGEPRTGCRWLGGSGGQAGATTRGGRPSIITGSVKPFPATVTGWSS